MKTRIINETEDFKKIECEWNVFLQECKQDNIFITFEWLFNWWECFHDKYSLFIIIVYDDKRICGIAPFMITKRLNFREIRFISSPIADYEDIIVSGDFSFRKKVVDAILKALICHNNWDILRLKGIKSCSPNYEIFNEIIKNRNNLNLRLERHKDGAPFIDLNVGWDCYCSGLKRKFLSDTKRRMSRLSETDARFSLGTVEGPDDYLNIYRKLVDLHIIRRRSLKTRSVFEDYSANIFFKKITEIFLRKGWLDLSYLKIEDTVVAVCMGFIYKNYYYYYIPSFDDNYKKNAVARLLLFHVLEKSFKNNHERFDFMLGEENYKKDFNPLVEPLYFVDIYRRTLKGYIAYLVYHKININLKKMVNGKW